MHWNDSCSLFSTTHWHMFVQDFFFFFSDHTAEDRSQPICKRLPGQLWFVCILQQLIFSCGKLHDSCLRCGFVCLLPFILLFVFRMYTAPESDRLTPSPTDSPRSTQIVPGARYAMQPFFQDQFVNNLPQNRFYTSERAVPQTNSLLSPQSEDASTASAQRWFVPPVQQPGSNKLDLSYENDYSTSSLLSYGIKPLSLQTSHALSYYPDSAFASMAAGWGTRSSYQRKMTTGLPWSPRPSPPAFPEDQLGITKDKMPEESAPPASTWIETSQSLKLMDSADSGVYSVVCKRRRMSPGGSSTENSPTIKCEDLTTEEYKDNPKGMGYYAFYTSP